MASSVMHCNCYSPLVADSRPISSSSSPSSSSITFSKATPVPTRMGLHSLAARVQQSESDDDQVHVGKCKTGNQGARTAGNYHSASSSSTTASSSVPSVYHRRDFVYLGAAVVGGSLAVGWEEAVAETEDPIVQRSSELAPASPQSTMSDKKVDSTITDKVFLDVSMCPNASRSDRTLGNTSQLCTLGEPLGRIVIGLYGRLVPQTVRNFKAMISGASGTSYAGTIFHRVLSGQFIQGGRQGSKEKGEVSGRLKLESNQETVNSRSYILTHSRPGTVSLALAENDDEEELKLDVDYRNVQFLITTGPGPAPQLDNANVIFGTVMEGLDVVAAVANVPTYRPSERIKQFNDFASFLGDERAANARNFWDRPLKTVVISGCGELPLGLPFFPPGLP